MWHDSAEKYRASSRLSPGSPGASRRTNPPLRARKCARFSVYHRSPAAEAPRLFIRDLAAAIAPVGASRFGIPSRDTISQMEDSASSPPPWTASPTAKERNAVQRAVTALLDELAPERVVSRAARLVGPIEQHRTPGGCVLQAASAAVSVSWFPEAASDATLGELHVVVWRGVVSRRGSPRRPDGAAVTGELVLRPIERPPDTQVWRAADGRTYDTEALAARCLALLEEAIGA